MTLQIPTDVLEDLRRVAQLKGFSDYRGLMRAYVGAALREDLERLEQQGRVGQKQTPSVDTTNWLQLPYVGRLR